VRATEPLPLHGSYSWKIRIDNPAGCVAVGVCSSMYKNWNTVPYNVPDAWVLSTHELDKRCLPKERCKGNIIHLCFNASARTLIFCGDFSDIQPLTGIAPGTIYPVVGGYCGAEMHVLLQETSIASSPDPFPSMASYMGSLLEDTADADVAVVVGSAEVLAHSLVLKRIPYFQRMLSGSFAESRKRKLRDPDGEAICRHRIALEDVDVEIVRRVLRFIYTDDHKSVLHGLEHTNLIALARAADMYGLSKVCDAACRMLEQAGKELELPEASILDALEFAHQLGRPNLRKSMMVHVTNRFSEVALTARFKALPQTNVGLYTEIIKEVAQNIKK